MKKGKSARQQPRHSLRFRVLSRDLPGYRAITIDLSQSGLQLETQASMTPGSELTLDLEFDREDLRDFSCAARVVWSKPDTGSRTRHFTGLTFLPKNDQDRTNLARMATVLHAHSETDLETLLEEAKHLDPERSETFARVKAARAAAPTSGASNAPRTRELPMLGVYIPLQLSLDSYQFDRGRQLLTLSFNDGKSAHQLYFPGCRLLTDYGIAAQPVVAGLFCTPHSEAIKKLPRLTHGLEWKHYRFLLPDRRPILELVSHPCQSHIG